MSEIGSKLLDVAYSKDVRPVMKNLITMIFDRDVVGVFASTAVGHCQTYSRGNSSYTSGKVRSNLIR